MTQRDAVGNTGFREQGCRARGGMGLAETQSQDQHRAADFIGCEPQPVPHPPHIAGRMIEMQGQKPRQRSVAVQCVTVSEQAGGGAGWQTILRPDLPQQDFQIFHQFAPFYRILIGQAAQALPEDIRLRRRMWPVHPQGLPGLLTFPPQCGPGMNRPVNRFRNRPQIIAQPRPPKHRQQFIPRKAQAFCFGRLKTAAHQAVRRPQFRLRGVFPHKTNRQWTIQLHRLPNPRPQPIPGGIAEQLAEAGMGRVRIRHHL